MIYAADLTDERIVEATAFAMDVPETNAQLIQLRHMALAAPSPWWKHAEHSARAGARMRCAQILNMRATRDFAVVKAEPEWSPYARRSA